MSLPVSKAGRRYGARKSSPDARDYGMARLPFNLRDAALAALTPSFSLATGGYLGPIRDQGDLGACTAFAGCAMRECVNNRWGDHAGDVFSPLFLYYLERQMDGDLDQGDTGSTGRTCVRVLNQFGVCLEPTDPYDIAIFNNPVPVAGIQEAAKYKAGAYHALSNVQDMKSCLASGYGFIVGFSVYGSFESDAMAQTGLMPVPNKTTESVLGGHEVFFCGYDDAKQCPGATPGAFEVQNSWGSAWGDGGRFWFPYQCIGDSDIFFDAFIIHLEKPW